jgi:hypothetical protein
MLEEYSVRSSDATIDIVYSDFSGNSIRDSDLISITNETHNNESNNFYKKIIISCSLILFISGLYLIIN